MSATRVEAEVYAFWAVSLHLIKSLQIGYFGFPTGYVVGYFKSDGSGFRSLAAFCFQLIVVALAAGVLAVGTQNSELFFASVSFLSLALVYVCEPAQRVRRNFEFSLIPDLVIAVMWLGCYSEIAPSLESTLDGFLQAANHALRLTEVWVLVGLVLAGGLGVFCIGGTQYFSSLRRGAFAFLGTASIVALFALDKLYITKLLAADSSAAYMLAFQLVVGGGLLFSSLNFITSVDLGRSTGGTGVVDREKMYDLLKRTLLVAGGMLIAVCLLAFFLSRFLLQGYSQLPIFAFWLGLGYYLFLSVGRQTILFVYRDAQLQPAIVAAAIVGVAAAALFWTPWAGASAFAICLVISCSLICIACSNIFFLRKIAKR